MPSRILKILERELINLILPLSLILVILVTINQIIIPINRDIKESEYIINQAQNISKEKRILIDSLSTLVIPKETQNLKNSITISDVSEAISFLFSLAKKEDIKINRSNPNNITKNGVTITLQFETPYKSLGLFLTNLERYSNDIEIIHLNLRESRDIISVSMSLYLSFNRENK